MTITSKANQAEQVIFVKEPHILKRGIETTEFWKTAINSMILCGTGIFLIIKGHLSEGVGLLLGVAGLNGTYNISRGISKKNDNQL